MGKSPIRSLCTLQAPPGVESLTHHSCHHSPIHLFMCPTDPPSVHPTTFLSVHLSIHPPTPHLSMRSHSPPSPGLYPPTLAIHPLFMCPSVHPCRHPSPTPPTHPSFPSATGLSTRSPHPHSLTSPSPHPPPHLSLHPPPHPSLPPSFHAGPSWTSCQYSGAHTGQGWGVAPHPSFDLQGHLGRLLDLSGP